ncbi:hypothetical protein J5N97_003837 [Dioscorea zingiberensis]|uniref:Uncharacterized protein n=1 Tax=Dioscorea zingiberensis TaxID=325984 RepID=A0A9D5D5D0_9LILI|nr:hypothetical protein J5N97_003837 [Dioscorea zingiberensis]
MVVVGSTMRLHTHAIIPGGRGFLTKSRYPYLKTASSFSSTPEQEEYDYIIVGGGTAACPLAATLSQKYSVLVLERGGSPYGNWNVSYLQNFHISLANTSPNSTSQPFISTDGVINARAKVLGGGTCINAGFYTRASHSFVKDAGWDFEVVNESYPWVEKQIVQWPKLAPWQTALRNGLLQAGISPFNGYTYDHIKGTKIGGTIFNKHGFRRTAADLLLAGNPKNLQVLLHATVQKILFNTTGTSTLTETVVFQLKAHFLDDDLYSLVSHFQMKHEMHFVHLMALIPEPTPCTIGSPQLLLLSGIGPKNDLKKQGITVILDNPYVGKGLSDNPMNSIFIPTKKPVEQSLIETVGITAFGSFIEASSGFGQSSESIRCHHGIMSAELGQLSTIPPSQRSLDVIKDYVRTKHELPTEAFRGGFILEKIDGPLSVGELTLLNTDIDSTPSITFNYFSHPADLQRCVHGIRTIEKIIQTKQFADLAEDDSDTLEILLNMSVRANVNLIPKHTNDTASLEQFCRDTVITIWHYHGGCHVGKVIDHKYRVLGVDNLRVIDSSTFNRSPGTNPQATVMMLGRYMGTKILRERSRDQQWKRERV